MWQERRVSFALYNTSSRRHTATNMPSFRDGITKQGNLGSKFRYTSLHKSSLRTQGYLGGMYSACTEPYVNSTSLPPVSVEAGSAARRNIRHYETTGGLIPLFAAHMFSPSSSAAARNKPKATTVNLSSLLASLGVPARGGAMTRPRDDNVAPTPPIARERIRTERKCLTEYTLTFFSAKTLASSCLHASA